jgi:Fe2+ transport system protein FeoA
LEVSLNKLRKGTKAKITCLGLDKTTINQLTSLGILIGDEIEVISKAILGGPISCRHQTNTFFSLRRSYAKNITVKEIQ